MIKYVHLCFSDNWLHFLFYRAYPKEGISLYKMHSPGKYLLWKEWVAVLRMKKVLKKAHACSTHFLPQDFILLSKKIPNIYFLFISDIISIRTWLICSRAKRKEYWCIKTFENYSCTPHTFVLTHQLKFILKNT